VDHGNHAPGLGTGVLLLYTMAGAGVQRIM